MGTPAIFLDRDGVINRLIYQREHGILDSPAVPDQFELFTGVAESISRFKLSGYRVVLVSNQPGIAKGYLTEDIFNAIRCRMQTLLAAGGVALDGEYYCLHHPEAVIPALKMRCSCRKPEPGLLLRAAQEMEIALEHSWMIGDNITDMVAGRAAGCRNILIGRKKCELCHLLEDEGITPDGIAANLAEAAEMILVEKELYANIY